MSKYIILLVSFVFSYSAALPPSDAFFPMSTKEDVKEKDEDKKVGKDIKDKGAKVEKEDKK